MDVVVALVGVVVEVFQLPLGHVVIIDIALQLLTVALQRSANIDSQGEANVAVDASTFRERAGIHLLKVGDERVVARNLLLVVDVEIAEGKRVLLELMILFCSRVAGVSEVKDVLKLLRIQ